MDDQKIKVTVNLTEDKGGPKPENDATIVKVTAEHEANNTAEESLPVDRADPLSECVDLTEEVSAGCYSWLTGILGAAADTCTSATAAAVGAASGSLPSTILGVGPPEELAGAAEAVEVAEDDGSVGEMMDEEVGAEEQEGRNEESKKRSKRKRSSTTTTTKQGAHIPSPLRLMSVSDGSNPYSFVTYVTIVMIYVFGLSLLPYACTHNPAQLYWPLLILFVTGITSVLLRTQLMIHVVPVAEIKEG